MTQEEFEILDKAIRWADGYFTSYCEATGYSVYDQEDIDDMDEDDEEKEIAQENRDYEDLLFKAKQIIYKYRKEK